MVHLPTDRKSIQVALLFIVFAVLVAGKGVMPGWLLTWPASVTLPIAEWLNQALFFLQDEFWKITVIDVEEDLAEETTAVMLISRGVSDALQSSIDVVRNILLGGRKGFALPALPWTAVAGIAFVIGYALQGWRLSLLAGLSVIYLAVFGQWQDSMRTLSLVFVAVPIALVLGLSLGVLAYRYKVVELTLAPLLNVAQSLPHFSYLIPVLVFFGIGDNAGAIATIIFATPPMIRLTLLGLKKVSVEVLESGRMSGCNNLQLLTQVQIPSARHDIMIGVNQVIMQCLAMVVIASFIGASGLGYTLLVMLGSLKIGKALELGISIVLIAIVLDRLSLAWAHKQPDYRADLPFYVRYKYWLAIVGLTLLSIIVSKFFPYAYKIPRSVAITTAPFWDFMVDWVVRNWYSGLQQFRTFLLVEVLIPMRDAYTSLPMVAVFALLMGAGLFLGGVRSALIVGAFFAFIALTGWWNKAMITAYMVSFSVLISVFIGLSIGIIASRRSFTTRYALLICDTLQTFPSFVYLIPVIMLFQVNDVSVLTAVIIYASIPATRYTIEGLRSVPQGLQEAATMSGVSRIQRLFKIELPLALPHIMLGVNQTVIFALFMVIIGAFIGTQDLGQEIMQALSESDMGKGLVLGLCVAFMGLAMDHLINRWALPRKQELGLA